MKIITKNKKAKFNYSFLEAFECGIVLMGSELKSIRAGRVNLNEAYCYEKQEEIWIKNLHISEYQSSSKYTHRPFRERKLLLKKKEIVNISKSLKNPGIALVPLSLYFNARSLVKVKVALSKGKKLYDKREDLKKKDSKREIDRAIKSRIQS